MFKLASRFAWRDLRRDWHQPALRVLALALIVAVAAVSAVGFFTDRLNRLMQQQATELLGADIQLGSANPLPPAFREKARELGLDSTVLVSFPSIVLFHGETSLTAVKAVDTGYPLRGELRISNSVDQTEYSTHALPTPGTVWMEPRLLQNLQAKTGDKVLLGRKEFEIARVLHYEPDRQGRFFQLAPRLLMHWDDMAATGLVTQGSRVRHNLSVAGKPGAVQVFKQWLEPQLSGDQTLRDLKDARPEMRSALERAQRFLSLAALASVLLAGAAVAIAAHYFARCQAGDSAVLRCLGASRALVLWSYTLRIFGLGIIAGAIGCALGWLAQYGLTSLLAQEVALQNLPTPGFEPALQGLAVALITLAGFALPPLLRIHTVPPIRVLREDIQGTPPASLHVAGAALFAMLALLFWQAGETKLALAVSAGAAATLFLLFGAAYTLLWLVRNLRRYQGQAKPRRTGKTALALRFGLLQLLRHPRTGSLQTGAFGLGIMALLLLAIVRVDLLDTWQRQLPEGTPNYFIVNIQAQDKDALQKRLPDTRNSGLHPMAVGRFTAINGEPVNAERYPGNARAQRMANRTFNLSAAAELPDSGRIIAGGPWTAALRNAVTVEEGFAKTMGIKLGDTLDFHVGGQKIQTQVASLREVQWDSFQVNFFITASPDVIEGLPVTYVTSFYLGANDKKLIPGLVRDFPGITVFDLNVLMRQVRMIMQRAGLAVQYVFAFTLLAGLMVLYAGITASQAQRRHEIAILRTLGASRAQIIGSLAVEFSLLGFFAGLLATSAASLLGWVLATKLFGLAYSFNPVLWTVGLLGSTLGIGLAGLFGVRAVLRQSPLAVLRSGTG